jgi:hypothetical protein
LSLLKLYVFLACILVANYGKAQDKAGLVASYSFNDKKDYDEISMQKAKLVGTDFTEDRFGNLNHAIRTYGDAYSYINLGKSKRLKQKVGTISLWVKIQRRVWAGSGYHANVILLTKQTNESDFYESYNICYNLENRKFGTTCCFDSLKQSCNESIKPIALYEWYHIVVSYDNNFHSFYLNGVLQRKATKNFETHFIETDSVLIGVTGNKKNNRFMDGEIDDLEFYNRVLSDSEVMALYHAPNPNKNRKILNWLMAGFAMVMLAGFIYVLIKYRIRVAVQKERKKFELINKLLETELRVNRALMNPHFVFNSLNTLQTFILKNENDRANDYLVKFSKLMRKILENNTTESISLEMEIDILKKYLDIENLRFEESIMYTVSIDPLLNASATRIPIMMLQPFIENAIWHGLLVKTGTKTLTISFSLFQSQYIQCIIEDNGLGKRESEHSSSEKESLGIRFVEQRLQLFNKIHNLDCNLSIHFKPGNTGTIVIINLPILP